MVKLTIDFLVTLAKRKSLLLITINNHYYYFDHNCFGCLQLQSKLYYLLRMLLFNCPSKIIVGTPNSIDSFGILF